MADAYLMSSALAAPTASADLRIQDWELSLRDHLEESGYDLSTLSFSIQKKALAPDIDPENEPDADGAPKP